MVSGANPAAVIQLIIVISTLTVELMLSAAWGVCDAVRSTQKLKLRLLMVMLMRI
jgi:hypothetical protein